MPSSEYTPSRADVDRFILASIDSVPHLEALLLLWQTKPQTWTVEEVAKRLWIEREHTRGILHDLVRSQFLTLTAGEQEQYACQADPGNDGILRGVAEIYRQDMVRISTMIHAKPSSAVKAFAKAFRFTKEQD
jgi:hypothetical protein